MINRPDIQCKGASCLACKNVIYRFLEALFGDVQQRYRSKVSVIIDDYLGHPSYPELKKIHDKLMKMAGRSLSGKNRRHLHQSDYFIVKRNQVVEFDEDQHFTLARYCSLRAYPSYLRLGFNKPSYEARCKKLHRNDTNPPYRDPQRAWYDTIRDFLYLIDDNVKRPTLRITIGECSWCGLNPKSKKDREFFKKKITVRNV